ncbi:MFS transporter [Bariatricus massiliensis]|uniref:MFS transporter n=1 Tax=Bariatricus massiliensis TaxID=1745713 RepID=A0ABS8DDC0_9FIRM|nr:MFS transporter [Bariatricus massiliensis]MCB7302534.1 MFS transporter [Bariatricus massiliensis]MCB7373750.1 MFS transporter [Bariatricus massiliensis]MCB7386420.1 MFS transporter [Bariatricus massiliensis]MCB7410582.1 MFS transporter [Bariatricus massiliensis]MCQ5253581.1 MFS transporter [Bariatricus massiliensis]
MKLNAKHTIYGCYMGYITQAVVNNLPPLLFLTFHRQFGVSLEKISLLISVNFCVQILVDFLSPRLIKRIGYRRTGVISFLFTIAGLSGFSWLPFLLPSAYAGLIICMFLNAVGGGILEVIISPMLEAAPSDNKESAMSLLHSFYCWGHMGVVILSTCYFAAAGIDSWRLLPTLWAFIPLFSAIWFLKIPIFEVPGDNGEEGLPGGLFRSGIFWVLFILMICSGASEHSIAQWSSMFAEEALGISKTAGDLLGPCSFAFCMGLSRLLYGLKGHKLNLKHGLLAASGLCVCGYLITVYAPIPVLSLAGCAVSGFAVGLMWPGVFSLAGTLCRGGGTFMYAMLALAGDVGCSAGPAVVGIISDTSGSMKSGILTAIVFPALMLIVMSLLNGRKSRPQA